MKAFILAAGVGSRLYSITQHRPKSLVRVAGKPILQFQIDAYLAAGIRQEDIFVATGYRSDAIDDFLRKTYPKVRVVENEEFKTTNNMFSLHMALSAADLSPGNSIVISNGDCIYDENIVRWLVQDERGDLVATDKGTYQEESMKVEVDQKFIRDISKQIPSSNAYGTSIDLYRISSESVPALRRIIEDYVITQDNRNLWTEVALKDLFQERDFEPLEIRGERWVEIDNLDDLIAADILFGDLDLDTKKCFVVDLDGTVYLGGTPIEDAVAFIRDRLETHRFFFLTNNTSKTPADYLARLGSLGITVDESSILAPHTPLIDHLVKNEVTNAFLVANERYASFLREKLPQMQWTEDPDACRAVILTYDTELTYEKLKTAALLLQSKDVRYIATHIDKVCPTEFGPIPDIGSFMALLETTTGRRPDVVFGKPSPSMLMPVREAFADEEVVVVGDRLYTDKVLAENAGVDFVLVLSGESRREDVERCETFPSLILPRLGVRSDRAEH